MATALNLARSIFGLLCFITLPACTPFVDGLETDKLRIGETDYSYQVYVPKSMPDSAPMVVALHRFTENGSLMARLTGLNEIAEREGFIVLYPNGLENRFEVYNSRKRDDSAMVLAMIEKTVRSLPVDSRRIYLTGASNGGFMVHLLASQHPEIFAAAAAVMAVMPAWIAQQFPSGEAVPMLIIHGSADRIVPETDTSLRYNANYTVLPIQDTVNYWVQRNESSVTPERTRVPDTDPDDGTTTERYTYAAGNAETVYYRVIGGGHTWPGGEERAPAFIVGPTSKDFSASETIWTFFDRHSR